MSVASPFRSEQVKEGGGESGLGGDCLDEAGAAAEPAALSSMQRAASTLSRRVPFILVRVAFFFSCKRLSCHGRWELFGATEGDLRCKAVQQSLRRRPGTDLGTCVH